MAAPAENLRQTELEWLARPPKPAHGWVGEFTRRNRYAAYTLLLGVAFLAVWEALARAELVDPVLVPAPTKIADGLLFLVRQDYFLKNFNVTIFEIIAGFLLGISIGVGLGILLATVRLVRLTLYPYIIAFQALPKVVLAPLFIVWFGFGPESKIATAAAICFFPALVNTLVGLQLVEEDALKLMRSLGASGWQTFIKLRLPNALPHIFTGLKTSLTFALTGVIVAEFLTGAADGLGRLVQVYNLQIQVDRELGVVLIVTTLGIAGVTLLDRLHRRIVFWRTDDEQTPAGYQ